VISGHFFAAADRDVFWHISLSVFALVENDMSQQRSENSMNRIKRPLRDLSRRVSLGVQQLEPRAVPAVGGLDATFAGTGTRSFAFLGPADAEKAAAVAVQPDGKIVAVGTFNFNGAASDSDFAIARFNNDGSLDTSFGNGGRVTVSFGFPNTSEKATCVAIQDDGKIVVAGYATISGDDDFVVARLNPDGSRDITFDGDGRRSFNFAAGGANNDRCFGVAIQTIAGARKIVLVGSIDVGGIENINFGVVRLNDNGSSDISFNRTLGGTDIARAVAIDSSNRIAVAGFTNAFSTNDFAVRRFNTNGTDDATFGNGGMQTANFGGDDQAFAVAIQPDGKIVVAGQGTGAQVDFCVARFLPGGFAGAGLDTATFGNGDGLVNVAFGGADIATGVAIQADGRIVVGGYTSIGGTASNPNNFAVARLTVAGVLDKTFNDITFPGLDNGDGKARFDLGGDDQAHGLALDNQGRIVLAGLTSGFSTVALGIRAISRPAPRPGPVGPRPLRITSAAKQFTRWLLKDRRAPDNALAHVSLPGAQSELRHDRRALTEDELRALLDAANSSSVDYVA
jgi:uncharacterized delta-60 repeat protein